MKLRWLAGLLGIAGALAPAGAAGIVSTERDAFYFELTGSARTFQLFLRQFETAAQDAETTPLTVSRVRTMTRLSVLDRLELEAAYEIVPVFGEMAAMGTGRDLTVASANLRYEDLHTPIDRSQTYQIDQNLDRLHIGWSQPEFDLRIGRQGLSHGSARVFNPTDIFVPFSPASLDSEYKRGVDGGTLMVPVGPAAHLELIAVFTGTDFGQGIYLARWQGTFPGFDISAYSGGTYGDATLAIDIVGEIGGTGLYSEALLRLQPGGSTDPHLRATLGAHHLFDFGLNVVVEAHYSAVGARDADDYLAALDREEYLHGEAHLLGQFYGAMVLDYELSPLIHLQTRYIQNVADGSALLGPTFSWDFSKNVAVNAGALLALGKRPRVLLTPVPEVTPRSEFGLYPNVYYADVHLYY